jgi:hypothetical protein
LRRTAATELLKVGVFFSLIAPDGWHCVVQDITDWACGQLSNLAKIDYLDHA